MRSVTGERTEAIFLPFWGKARPQSAGPNWHPLAYHSLDVAAVGRVLLQRVSAFRERLSAMSGIGSDECVEWMTLLLAWHDVGKFAEGFQGAVPELRAALGHARPHVPYQRRHDSLGQDALLSRLLVPILEEILAAHHPESDADPEELTDAFAPWLGAMTGHHGAPPDQSRAISDPISRHFPAPVLEAALDWCRASFALLWGRPLPLPVEDAETIEERGRLSGWLAAGLAVAADWIGSDQGWFPYEEPSRSIDAYWKEIALPRAEAAVEACGITVGSLRDARALRALFPDIAEPTPLQALVGDLALAEGPQLWLIEEATGAGKTEAALTLAHRLLAAGRAESIYIALPTMATANAMHRRVEAMYPRLFEDGSEPTLVLSHGRAGLAHVLARRVRAPEDDYADGDLSATTRAAAWFADHRKAALLAPIGVGTIDQALLAVLPSRHQSLRLLGLSRAVLVVDEVHACDAYMHRLLCTLLQFHAALGGSAILLSATVADHTRDAFLRAFAQGIGARAPAAQSTSFPRVTGLSAAGLVEHAPSSRTSCQRQVEVRWVDSADAALRVIVDAAEAGRCVAWVRNTVDDAIEAAAALGARLGEERVDLFHARYALGDRLAIERRVLERFGPSSGPEERAGRVVVATQVIEQSLDLDFDVMVSDLAPIDLLVQRAGRLCRHRRDATGRRCDLVTDGRSAPVLWVLGPDAGGEVGADWLRRVLPRVAPVYPDLGVLWRTAAWLQRRGGFTLPTDARDLIESVFGLDAREDHPAALGAAVDQAEGKAMAARSTAQLAALAFDAGYTTTGQPWLDEARALTRLGEPTVTLRLARRQGDRLVPWIDDAEPRVAWSLSEVSVRQARVGAEAPADRRAADLARAAMHDRGRFVLVVALTVDAEGIGHGKALDDRGRSVTLRYHPHTGLSFVRARRDA